MQLFIWQISSSTFILLYLHLKDFTLYRLIFIISYEDGLPVDKHVISLVGTVQSGPPRLLHFYWSGCQYIFQSGWSCHCGWSLHYQKLQNKTWCEYWIAYQRNQKVEWCRSILYVSLQTSLPSKIGLASKICCSIQERCPLTAARNCSMSLVLSVFPAPDSPLTNTTHTDTLRTHQTDNADRM